MSASAITFTEEQPSTRGVDAAATSIAGFVGITERGPMGVATSIGSPEEYRKVFGGYLSTSDIPQTIDAFFASGGKNCYVVRTCHYSTGTPTATGGTVTLKDTGNTVDNLKVDSKDLGGYSTGVTVTIADASSGDAAKFDLSVYKGGVLVETFPNLSTDPADLRFVESVVNSAIFGSDYIKVTSLDVTSPYARPKNVSAVALVGGADGLTSIADIDFVGDSTTKNGLHAFDRIFDVAGLAVPGKATATIQTALLTYCEVTKEGKCFAVLDPPAGNSKSQIVTYVTTTAALEGLSEQGAIYWPRLKVANPDKTIFGSSDTITVPPSGFVLGRYAKNDSTGDAGVFKTPAGVDDGALPATVLGLETDEVLEKGVRDVVTSHRINPITRLPGYPYFIDDSMGLKASGIFPYVGQRRGQNYIKASLDNGLQWVRHKNNTPALRAEVSRSAKAFLLPLCRAGAFATTNPSLAFFVQCNDDNNPPSVVLAGKLKLKYGTAPATPARMVEVTVTKDTRALDAELAAAAG